MATRTFKPKRDDTMLTEWQSMPEVAPSTTRKEGTLTGQIFLFVGFFLTLVGSLALIAPLTGWSYFIRPGAGYATLSLGLCFMLYHCFVDPEIQFRRMYGLAGLGLVTAALVIRFFPSDVGMGAKFLPLGVPFLFVAMLFLIGVGRHETDPFWRTLIRGTLLGVAAAGLLWGIGRGFFNADFLTEEGIVTIVLGLLFALAYMSLVGEREADAGYRVAIALGALGALTFVAAAVRSLTNDEFLVPSGLILGAVGVVAMTLAYLNSSDRPMIVLARRELNSYFFSPIAYLVIFGLLFIFWFNFYVFSSQFDRRGGIFEPIVYPYAFSLFTVISIVIMVPFLTMRLLSEERRSGSLEVLLTAPLNEASIVFGKFLAAWIFFLIAWAPFFVFLVSLRIFGDQSFDYRPVMSFFLALAATGAGFLAMGLFFSSLTSNQIVAAVLTFAGMLLAMGTYWLGEIANNQAIREICSYCSFLGLWSEAARGFFPVRYFVLHLSVAAFFLYLTTLTLSARKWN